MDRNHVRVPHAIDLDAHLSEHAAGAGVPRGCAPEDALGPAREVVAEIEQLGEAIATAQGTAYDEAMARYADALDFADRIDAYGASARLAAVLAGLGLAHLTEETPVAILSGGQKTRAALAGMELEQVETEGWSLAAGDAVFVRSPDVSFTVLDGEAVLLNLENGVYYTLNPVGTVTWELIIGERTLTEIVSAVRERYDINEETARRDLAALVSRLRREGLIAERR